MAENNKQQIPDENGKQWKLKGAQKGSQWVFSSFFSQR